MHQTVTEAQKYAEMLVALHVRPFVVVQLPLDYESKMHRLRFGIHGDYYGGVRLDELQLWLEGGATAIMCLHPLLTLSASA